MSTIPGFDFIGTATSLFTTNTLDVSEFQHVRVTLFCAADCDLTFNWSMNKGVDVDLVETVSVTSGNTVTQSISIKTKYLFLGYDPISTPSALRCTLLFFHEPASLSVLANVGTGADLYKTNEHKIRTLKSSDLSVNITEDTSEVDLTVTIPSSVTVSATSANIQVGTSPNYTLDVGKSKSATSMLITDRANTNITGGGLVMIGHQTVDDTSTATNSVHIGYQNRITTTGNGQNVSIGSQVGQINGTSTVCIGSSIGTTAGKNVIIGGSNGGAPNNDAGVSIGYLNGVLQNSSVYVGYGVATTPSGQKTTIVGHQSGASGSVAVDSCTYGYWTALNGCGTGAICIGSRCIQTGSTGTYSINLGHQCAGGDTTSGRLHMGAFSEAPHGSFSMPNAGVPEAYLKVKWNGTLYYIPAFTTVPS